MTSTTNTTAVHRRMTQAVPARGARALAAISSVVAALAAWTLAVPLLGIDLKVLASPDGGQISTVGPGSVAAASLVACMLGWGLLEALEHRTTLARRIWTITAVGALLLSLAGPLGGGITVGAKLTLALLHLTVAAVFIPLLRRTASHEPQHPPTSQ